MFSFLGYLILKPEDKADSDKLRALQEGRAHIGKNPKQPRRGPKKAKSEASGGAEKLFPAPAVDSPSTEIEAPSEASQEVGGV